MNDEETAEWAELQTAWSRREELEINNCLDRIETVIGIWDESTEVKLREVLTQFNNGDFLND